MKIGFNIDKLFYWIFLTILWIHFSAIGLEAKTDNSKKKSFLNPIKLLRDDTDKVIENTTIPEFPKTRPKKSFQPGTQLTLDKALSIVDTHYPKLLQGGIEVNKAEAKVLESQGAFDPVVKHISEYKRIQDITVAGLPKDAVHNEGQLEVMTRSGIKLFARIRVNPDDASSPILQSGRSGEYTGGAIIPLFRNFIVNPARAKEQKAKLGQPLANTNLNLSRMNVLFDTSVAFWDFYAAFLKLEIVRGLVEIAENRANLVRNRVKEGDLPALAIKEAEKEIRRRRGAYVGAERRLNQKAFKLSLFLWSDRGNTPPKIDISMLRKAPFNPKPLTLTAINSGIERAQLVRPELSAIRIQKEIVKVDLKVAKNLMLPKVDLIYRQGYDTGVNGIGNVYTGGVEVALPLRLRRARGLVQQAKLQLKKLDLEETFLKRKINIEVRDTASELNAAYRRYKEVQEEVKKARALEQGERQRFNLGDSSLFLVNRRERDRAEAEDKSIEITRLYLTTMAAFKAITGDI